MAATMATPLTAKQVRLAHSALRNAESTLEQHAALLHRLYYKSKAQHRSAKWFQSLDGVRKCLRRLLSDLEQEGEVFTISSSRYTANVEVDTSLPNRAGHAERRARNVKKFPSLRRPRDVRIQHTALFKSASIALAGTWCGFWGDENHGEMTLPKYDRPPTTSPSERTVELAIFWMFRLLIALEELRSRSQLSFSLLTAQLRTPPAPMFAALVSVLCTLMAAIHHSTQLAMWGLSSNAEFADDGDGASSDPASDSPQRAEDAISAQYTLLCRSLEKYDPNRCFVLDSQSRALKQEWRRINDLVQRADRKALPKDLSWLPHSVIRTTNPGEISKLHQITSSRGQSTSRSLKVPIVETKFEMEEDIGEVL